METVTLTDVFVRHPLYLMRFLDLVTKGAFGRIPRAKGYLPCGGTGSALTSWKTTG
ncbi:hypothetical protein M5E89_01120 [Acidaminococcus intestini]|nr:hypothetical protein M5E89_01120 [Acidaminococcus intestini]